ncbi:MAG: hypothetical protein V1844_12680 [Pseudomonadota bacterium]
MAGNGVAHTEQPIEGKINFLAAGGGLLVVNEQRLEIFNRIAGVRKILNSGADLRPVF